MKEKIKGWWNENEYDIKEFAAKAGVGVLIGTGIGIIFGGGMRLGAAVEKAKFGVSYSLVCARNPEIKTMIEKATEEVTEIIK